MSTITLTNLTKQFRTKEGLVTAVGGLDLVVERGTVLALVGPSGCGKSTTLRMIAGAEQPSSGSIEIGGRVVADGDRRIDVPPDKRNIGMVFQSYALWPHMKVFENVAYPLRRQGRTKTLKQDVARNLDAVGCGHLADRYPYELSGGQQQRIALARALAADPAVVLFDEPLSNLDAKLRDRLRFELKEIQDELKFTAVYVTHDQSEALTLGHRVAVMNSGHIEQLGSPQDVYREPQTSFVFDFLGASAYFEGVVVAVDEEHVHLQTPDGPLRARRHGEIAVGETVRAGFRVEDGAVADESEARRPGLNVLPCEVLNTYFSGASQLCRIRTGSGVVMRLELSSRQSLPQRPVLVVDPDACLVYGAQR